MSDKDKKSKRFIRCSNCNAKIYDGDIVFKVPGIIYNGCSRGCLASLMLNVHPYILGDTFVKEDGEEWEYEDTSDELE